MRADFLRRLLEGQILQYRLREDEQKGKGPMVVCIDVSSSMQGDKELWAKAVSLTLMDIARRQRRLFRAVLFSSGPESSRKVIDLNRQRRYQPELPKVLEMAEYFPGGGTDFEAPIDAAIALLEDKKLKRGDIVSSPTANVRVAPSGSRICGSARTSCSSRFSRCWSMSARASFRRWRSSAIRSLR